ncbi:bifunctional DNA primase/polymerase [Isoptericola sediminis]|uniref:AAA family ATPase n=1 Tax=Isoptericola sediminis TaxID=2733572 RepID=A0A849K512_9MICO|nr:bifunctional DNA primase/polymerase [Isoptericola sediminis]NNU27971.1 AAA family ATPase [Isoptericola sediminis]
MAPRLDSRTLQAVRAHGTSDTPADAPATTPDSRDGQRDPFAGLPEGVRLFPLRRVTSDGECTCSRDHCASAGKHPTITGWEARATSEPAEVRRWLDRFGGNLGVACGPSGLVVLDADRKRELERLCKAYGHDVPSTFKVRTGKGFHYWFRVPDDVEVRNSDALRALGFEVDVRGAGGFVVAPGSTHVSGRRYEVADDTEPQSLPDWVLELLQATTPDPGDDGDAPVSEAQALAALDAACEDLADAVNGQRNGTLNAKAYYLGRMVGGGLLDRAEVEERLTEVALEAGLGKDETRATLRSGLRRGEARPRKVADDDSDAEPPSTLTALDWAEAWRQYREGGSSEDWIVYPLLPARRLVVLYSLPKVGKSLLMLEVAVGIACGTEVLGSTPPRPHRVLYLDYENDPMGDLLPRLESMGHDESLDLSNLHLLSFPVLGGLDTRLGAQRLLEYVDEHDVEVVVIDTVSRAVDGPENDNDTWLNMYRHLGLALKQRGVSLIRMDHAGKDETKGQRGGSAKSGDVDAVWRLTRQGDSQSRFVLACEAHRHQVPHTKLVLTRHADPLVHEAELVEHHHAEAEPDEFRPTHLMERISVWLETYGPATRSVVVKGKDENGQFNVPGKAQAKGRAFSLLVSEEYLRRKSGDEYEVVRGYREDTEEPGEPAGNRLSDEEVDETW